MKMKGVIATGHPLTSGAAADMFRLGGNAFDAAVSAGFASVATEPTFTSLGGGGFFLAHTAKEKKNILFDFFVNTPGLGSQGDVNPVMSAVDIKFPECTQVFHTGFGSAAVPGMLKGLLHVHKRLCTLPLTMILEPAFRYLNEGVEVSELQEYVLNLLEPIFTSSSYGRELYIKNGRYIRRGERFFNPLLRDFLHGIADESTDIYSGLTAKKLADEIKEHNGMITGRDLDIYEVIEREPLLIRYRDREIITNPPPSSGGMLLALSLQMNNNNRIALPQHDPKGFYSMVLDIIKETEAAKTFISSKGTTHISVIDDEGNAVSFTSSNGSGSGRFIPGTGIMLNNMMGEDDLHPKGFFTFPPGIRVPSMMIPTMVMKDGKVESALGSGGSKRIRTAILQVLMNIIDFRYSLEKAVESPRVHYEDGTVHIEPGISREVIDGLRKHYKVNHWSSKNMYFGGVHCVNRNREGWGDSRRGGNFIAIE